MKTLLFINGTMGAGKSTVCQALKRMIPPAVVLDGDWCWDAYPFTVTDETKAMVTDHICHLLNGFLHCSAYQNVIFGWVMDDPAVVDALRARLDLRDVRFRLYTLTLTESALRTRLQADIDAGRRTPDILDRSVARLPRYARTDGVPIDVSTISAAEAAARIAADVRNIW